MSLRWKEVSVFHTGIVLHRIQMSCIRQEGIYHLRACHLWLLAPQGVGSHLHGRNIGLVREFNLQLLAPQREGTHKHLWCHCKYLRHISFRINGLQCLQALSIVAITNIYHLRDWYLYVVAVQGVVSLPYGHSIAPFRDSIYNAREYLPSAWEQRATPCITTSCKWYRRRCLSFFFYRCFQK